MEQNDRTTVTVYRPLLERLTAFLERLKRRAARCPGKYPPTLSKGKVGVGDAIEYLLLCHDQEAARKRAYGKMRRAARKAEQHVRGG